MAFLHILHYLYQHILTLVGSTTSTTTNKLKLIAALVALLTYKYRSHAIGTRRRDDLKEPKGAVPFFGHMFLMASIPGAKLHDTFVKNYRELGPVWSISLPGIGRMIQGDTPEMIEHVSKTNFWAYEKGEHLNNALGDVFGKGVILTDGDEWKRQRKEITQVLNIKLFREYSGEALNKAGQKVIDYLDMAAASGSVVDFHELMHAFTLDSFASVLFGESYGCLENIGGKTPFADAITELFEIASDRIVDPIWKYREALTTVGAKARQRKNILRQHIQRLIAKHRKEGEEDGSTQDQKKKKNVLMMFMEATGEDGQPYSDNHIVDSMLNLTIGSRDTTAQGISWMMYLLLREESDPALLETFVREADEVLGDCLPSYDTHKKQKFAEAWMFPSLPRNLRLCVQDDTLPDGTRIYAGEWFTWSSYAMGRSERIWGPDVHEFKPSRWLDNEKLSSLNKTNPFHVGPRACVGQGFAMLQATSIMALVLKNFEVTLVEPEKLPTYGVGMTLPMLDGLPVRVARRA
ncbi:hypothetical protein BGZ47_004703 [Haplosporangium gracile]|nr:hypothetical protein BGZ47_004703 [Haplosporangium gracile]